MTTLEDAVEFFNFYLDIDRDGNNAVRTEPDDVVNSLRSKIMRLWNSVPGVPLSPSFGRPMGMTPENLAEMAAHMERVRRPLFTVAEYQDPAWQVLYAAYIGGNKPTTAQAYGGLLYATGIQGELKIIASYREDIDKEPPPMHWQHVQGAEIALAGPPVAVRTFQGPTAIEAHLQDWEMLRNSAGPR
ncbi:hypothetical protein ACF07T_21150 [Streptomyces sp. NPDC015184]|uniref:hypothetical protein n=1 Tax=Streptomyces sp. NPDC015184 TaxID=3364946 RepID=UPI00370265F7